MTEGTHKFEAAGLGTAPYRFVGVNRNVYSACQGHQQPGGTCSYCGTGIMYEYTLVSADGKRFCVGSECIHKSGDAGLIRVAKREENKRRTEATHARQDAQIKAARALLAQPEVRARLDSLPKPGVTPEVWAGRGRGYTVHSLLQWAEWMLAHAGRTGKTTAARAIETALKEEERAGAGQH